jgi:hypothetical protein
MQHDWPNRCKTDQCKAVTALDGGRPAPDNRSPQCLIGRHHVGSMRRQQRPHRSVLSKWVASLVLYVATGACLATVLLVAGWTWLDAATPYGPPATTDPISPKLESSPPADGHARITVKIIGISAADRLATGSVELRFDPAVLSTLWDVADRQYLFTPDPITRALVVSPAYAKKVITLTLFDLNGLSEATQSVTLDSFSFLSIPEYASHVVFTVTADGDPRAFPSDEYEIRLQVYFQLPTDVAFRTSNIATGVPTESDVDVSPALRAYEIYRLSTAKGLPSSSTQVNLKIMRNKFGRIFVYMIGCLPFLLGAAIATRWLFKPTESSEPLGLVIGLGAVALTLLPLHSVIVPSDLPLMTRFDLMLAIATAVLISGAVFALANNVWPHESETDWT